MDKPLMNSNQEKKKSGRLRIISLFTGAGGLDIGFHNAGFEIAVAVESDPACCETLRKNMPNLNIIEGRIEDISTDEILLAAGLKPLEAALVIGGPPCQPFSLAGNRLGLNDPRGHLLMEFIRVVREALPKAFLIENVKGMASWDKGRVIDLLMEELAIPISHGENIYEYSLAEPKTLNALDYGVPQSRERIFFVGNRLGLGFCFPEPTHYPEKKGMSLNGQRHKTVWDAIGNLPKADEPSKTAVLVAGTIKGRIERHGY